jgi:transposase InsO family protein
VRAIPTLAHDERGRDLEAEPAQQANAAAEIERAGQNNRRNLPNQQLGKRRARTKQCCRGQCEDHTGFHSGFFCQVNQKPEKYRMNVRRNPNSLWVVQQLRDAWAYQKPHRFLLFDRDAKFGADVVAAVRQMGSQPTRTAFRSPWQNGVAERWVGSCRRELLDHVIILNERHLKRLMSLYLLYYHEDRTHLGLGKDTPVGRVATSVSPGGNKIISWPRLGGLHHRYAVAA